MRRARQVDANHGQIRDGLRKCGFWVWDSSHVGGGFPDLIVWAHGRFLLLEVKDGQKPPSRRELTTAEQRFFDGCPGESYTVKNIDEAITACQYFTNKQKPTGQGETNGEH